MLLFFNPGISLYSLRISFLLKLLLCHKFHDFEWQQNKAGSFAQHWLWCSNRPGRGMSALKSKSLKSQSHQLETETRNHSSFFTQTLKCHSQKCSVRYFFTSLQSYPLRFRFALHDEPLPVLPSAQLCCPLISDDSYAGHRGPT